MKIKFIESRPRRKGWKPIFDHMSTRYSSLTSLIISPQMFEPNRTVDPAPIETTMEPDETTEECSLDPHR